MAVSPEWMSDVSEKLGSVIRGVDALNDKQAKQNGNVARLWERTDKTEARIGAIETTIEQRLGSIELSMERRLGEIRTALSETKNAVEADRTRRAAEEAAEEKAVAPWHRMAEKMAWVLISVLVVLVLINAKDFLKLIHIGG